MLVANGFIIIYKDMNFYKILCIFFKYLIIYFFSKAIYYDSSLIGFMTILAFYTVLGFSFACYGLCYCIGFDDKDSIKRVFSFLNLF